jgi:hypothetical protein
VESGEKYVHISSLHGALVSIKYAGESVEYTLNLSALGTNCINILVARRSVNCVYEEYRVDLSTQRVEYLSSKNSAFEFSTGYSRLDSLVGDISNLRRAWCTSICDCSISSVKCYEVFLKAKIAHVYNLYKRVKEAWLEYSQEYLGFIYGLVDSALREHCNVTHARGLREVCMRANRAESTSWSNVVVEYECRDKPLRVYLERMINGVKPDLIIESGSHRLLIECKQGPAKTWLAKATKQAKKYRTISSQLVLVTPRALGEQDLNTLRQHYDTVISECTAPGLNCKARLHEEVAKIITHTH